MKTPATYNLRDVRVNCTEREVLGRNGQFGEDVEHGTADNTALDTPEHNNGWH